MPTSRSVFISDGDIVESFANGNYNKPFIQIIGATQNFFILKDRFKRQIQRGCRGRALPLFCNHLFFWNQFEELQNVLIEVKLITDKAPFICVYPNTIKTYLTFNHSLIGRQLLCYSNSSSTVVRNLTVLSSTTDKINRISNHF